MSKQATDPIFCSDSSEVALEDNKISGKLHIIDLHLLGWMITWKASKSTIFWLDFMEGFQICQFLVGRVFMGALHFHSITGVRLSEGKLSGLINMTRWGDATLETKYIVSCSNIS